MISGMRILYSGRRMSCATYGKGTIPGIDNGVAERSSLHLLEANEDSYH
jgi:hypothetical protein